MKQKPKLQALNTLLSNNNTVSLATMAAAEATMAVINLDARTARLRQSSRGGNLEADYRLVPHATLDAYVKEDKNNVIYSENNRTIYYDINGDRLTQRPSVRSAGSPVPAPTPAPGGQPQPNPPAPSSGIGYDDSEVTVTPGKGNTVAGFELTLKGQNQPLQGSFLWNGSKWVAK